MAREHAAIRLDMWTDDEWRALTVPAQHLYMHLLSSPSLSYAGVADWRPARIAGMSADSTPRGVVDAAADLIAALFVVCDDGTEEVLIRSYLKHDGLLHKPNVAKAMVTAYGKTVSPKLRGVIVHELTKLHGKHPEWKGFTVREVQELLSRPSINPSDLLLEGFQKDAGKGSDFDPSLLTPNSLLPTPNSQLLSTFKNVVQPPASLDTMFDEWWAAYPRKQGKPDALKAFKATLKTTDITTLMIATRAYTLLNAGQEKSYLKMPAGWLRSGRWADEDQVAYTPADAPAPRTVHKFVAHKDCGTHEGYPLPCEKCARNAGLPEGAEF